MSSTVGWGIVAWVVGIAFFLPVLWMVITAFKRDSDLYNLDSIPFLFNQPPTLEHVKLLFLQTSFVRWVENSLLIGTVVVIVTLLTAVHRFVMVWRQATPAEPTASAATRERRPHRLRIFRGRPAPRRRSAGHPGPAPAGPPPAGIRAAAPGCRRG